jgi:3-phosphoshikimate 1-carboxyvinyltransferase
MAHRAVLCAALAQGESHIQNLEFSKDISVTLDAAAQLCAEVQRGKNDATIRGLGHFLPVDRPVDCCESGSSLRFLIPLFSLNGQPVTFVGQGRLMERPQNVYAELFHAQGLPFEQENGAISVQGPLHAGEYMLAGDVSSQFISGLLFTLPLLKSDSILHLLPPVESRSYIEMTRAAQASFGVYSEWKDETTLHIAGGQTYRSGEHTVEGDYSQAAFLAVLGAVCGGVTVTGLAAETLQGDAVILDILRRCGAMFACEKDGIRFAKSTLHACDIDLADCPDLGPILMVLAMFCEGTTIIRNAGRLRLKESDRIAAMEQELRRCGGQIESEGGTVTLHKSELHAPTEAFSGHNDHRIVMSMAVLTLACGFSAQIEGAEAVRKSWPNFFSVIETLGAEVEQIG